VARALRTALILAVLSLAACGHLRAALASRNVVETDVSSPMLTAFRNAPTVIRAQVLLPDSYGDEAERRYPTIFWVHGFDNDYRLNAVWIDRWKDAMNAAGTAFIVVALDGSIDTGHHEFANSANNGPWGDALVREFIPSLDQKFRTIANPADRFLAGHSSGGWSVLWLQINYPSEFGGAWSLAPDPVDFHDFTGPNLWRQPSQNFYHAPEGAPYWLVRLRGRDVETIQTYVQREDRTPPQDRQFDSFDAVFSPREADGTPQRLFDHQTGAIDPAVERYWDEHYDIAHLIDERWPQLEPKLHGKLHVIVGTEDTYHLEGAVRLLGAELKRLGSDAEVVVAPGYDHSTIFRYDGGLIRHVVNQMAAREKQEGR
jgi:S-formylglutathione hydrolase FrmB